MYPGKQRNTRLPADFNTDGDIVPERWPMGGAVVLWMHGLPLVLIFSGYYLLAGGYVYVYKRSTLTIDFVTGLPKTKKGLDAVAIYTCKSTKRIGSTPGKKTWKGYDYDYGSHEISFPLCPCKRFVALDLGA
ncbi:hypothetical protein N7527_007191 [Penicillium freii]|nr:hypothetical protein N7527_007191 [Penicillium freii]